MKNKKRDKYIKIGIITVFFVIIFLVIYKNKDGKLWEANIIQILTLVNAFIAAFFIVQNLTEKRRHIDCVDKIVLDLQKEIANNENIYSDDTKKARLVQRSISNKIKYLKDYSNGDVKKEFEYIEDQMKQLKEMYDNHSNTAQNLESVRMDFIRYMNNITDKCVKIRLMLYEV